MGMGSMKQVKVKCKRKFTLDEIYDILSKEGNFPAEHPLSIRGAGLLRGVFVRGIGKYDVSISMMGTTLICCEYVRKGEQAKNLLISSLTSGWSDILDKDSKANVEITKMVGAECQRVLADHD